ncbi:MAG: hypothetical protein VX278_16095, partial [Myxococcota bacterium]|nr:hypothetical protein [Myxococcota bacterium]
RSAYYFPTDTPLDLLPNPNPNIKKTKDNASEDSENTRADYGNDLFETERGEKTGHKGVREVINEELRHLYHFVGLQSFNKGLTRQPPKLNVFLVVDLCEPLSRSVLRDLTREIAAEITRVTGAIFQIERGGLAKLISIVPIVWMPNVADPTEGKNISSQNRGRMEGSILHSLYSFRRWLSTVPSNLRCMRQMFINSRMTDNAFWGTRDAVSQTVQFMQMSLHNDLSTTPAIAPTRAIARGGNYYASFSCHQIDFPEFRAREYLATQLGRDFLASLQQPWVGESKYLQQKLTIPDEEEQHEEVSAELEEIIQPIAESISSLVPVESLTASMTNLEILQRFDMGLLDDINQAMMKEFRRVVSQGSEIERLLLAQRKEKQQELQRDLAALIRESDAFVTDGVVRIGLDLVRTGLLDRKNQAYDLLRKADENIQQTGEESFTNDIPNSKSLNGLFEQVIDAILARPAQRPMRLAFGTLLLFSFVLIGPLIWGAMKAAKLYLFPNPLELFLWKGLPVLLAALISYGAYWFLQSRYIKAHQALIDAASQLRGAVYQLIAAPRNSSPSSLFGFFDSRLKLVTSSFIRSYANSLQEQTAVDARFGNRMFRSAKKQSEILQLKMESLGVRILPSLAGKSERVVLSELFKLKNATYQNNLIQPQLLQEYYQREYGAQDSWRYHAEGLLRKLGGLQSWRDEAPLADTDKILGLGRQRFSALIHTPITELDQSFSESISDNIRNFIHKIYPNMGFGADFDGKEGSDPDGLETKIVGSIIINEDMELTLKGLLHKDHAIRTIPKMSVDIRPNSMYLLSISTGLSSLIIRNIHRYESPLENREERIDSLFPFSFEYIPTKGENEEEDRNRPLTPLMGFLKETLEGAHDPEVPPDTDKEEGSS